jgi:hypothetical protein
MHFSKLFFNSNSEKIQKTHLKIFFKAKKFDKCVPKHLFKGKNKNPKSKKETQGWKEKNSFVNSKNK